MIFVICESDGNEPTMGDLKIGADDAFHCLTVGEMAEGLRQL
jgi:hypothetical protein